MVNSTDAKEEVKRSLMDALCIVMTKEELVVRINDYEKYASQESCQKQKAQWHKSAAACRELLNDEDYLSGNYPQSLDKLILDLVEWRALTEAMQKAVQVDSTLGGSPFFCMWFTGAGYSAIATFGKLASNSQNEPRSILKLWHCSEHYLVEDGIVSEVERVEISKKVSIFKGRNLESSVLHNRNKAFMHNEHMGNLTWEKFDEEFRVVARIWSLLTQWTGPIFMPFAHKNQLTNGMERFLDSAAIQQCKNAADLYIKSFEDWCITSLVDNEPDGKTPFGTLNFQFSIV